MNKLIPFFVAIAGTSTLALFAGCGDVAEGRVEITPPAADLTFDEAFIKDRDIHLHMPEDVVLGQIGFVLVDAQGHLIVIDHKRDSVFQTDAEGRYLRPIGARGGAEGEYFHALYPRLAPNGDLYFYSLGSSKYLFFSGDSYTFKREIPNPHPHVDNMVLTEAGHFYSSQVDVTGGGQEDGEGQYALFRLDDTLNKVAFLYPVEDKRTGLALNRYKSTVLTPKRGGGFYFMYPTTYEIHQYSEQGQLEQTWFSDYQSKYREGIKPFPANLNPYGWNAQIEAWFAEHIVQSRLYEFGSDLLVLTQYRAVDRAKTEYYLSLFYKDGHSVADGIREPAGHMLLTVTDTELYFAVEGAFDEATGEAGDPYIAVYRLNARQEAFSRS